MALASLAILVPLVAAVLLGGTTSLRRRRVADAVALGAAVAAMGLCLALLARSSGTPIVAWLGGWHPRHGVAIGIDLFADPLAAGLAAFAALLTVAACSFVGTSLYALSGMALHDPAVPVAEALRVIPVAVLYDVLVTPFVLPVLMKLFRRLRPPQRVAY